MMNSDKELMITTRGIWEAWRRSTRFVYVVLPDKRRYHWVHGHIFQKLGKLTNTQIGRDDAKVIWIAISNGEARYEVVKP